MSVSRHMLKGFIISGIMLAFTMPATPAMAEDTNTVDATNNSSQTAETGVSAETETAPSVKPVTPKAPSEETTVLGGETYATDSSEVPAEETPADDNSATSAVVDNSLDSDAQSGNATVSNNIEGGNATTGSAEALATIINLLQSTSSLGADSINTFIQDIYGDVFGDFHIDPRVMSNADYVTKRPDEGVTVNVDADARINNNVSLSALTGNAYVTDNVAGGNATTGDATALLNLINIINSWAVANQSFIGMINIHGNLNGDILLPESLLQHLLAHNAAGGAGDDPLQSLETATTMGIENNIHQVAQSGTATVADNVAGGNALTGGAQTKLTLLNLTNRQIIGKDALLVFVNVLGNWVGMIVNAPQGATAAALGDVTSGTADTSGLGGGSLSSSTNAKIVNNIDLSATTGDASVTGNVEGGDATSGDARTAVNLVNIINSQLSFSDWFGVLFINVFGNWTGSFGVDTAAGELPAPQTPAAPAPTGIINFTPTASSTNNTVTRIKVVNAATTVEEKKTENTNQTVLSFVDDKGIFPPAAYADADGAPVVAALGGLACFFLLGAAEKRRENKKAAIGAASKHISAISV